MGNNSFNVCKILTLQFIFELFKFLKKLKGCNTKLKGCNTKLNYFMASIFIEFWSDGNFIKLIYKSKYVFEVIILSKINMNISRFDTVTLTF